MTHITKDYLKEWAVAAGIRAIKTVAQTAAAMLPVGATIHEVGWLTVLSTALLAGVLSLLTSVAGIPEAAGGKDVATIVAHNGDHAE